VRLLKRPLLLATGWLCVALGVIGAFVPLLPTTPFLILAVWAFSQSSPAMADKIRSNRIVGPYVRDWQDSGVIPFRAKVLSLLMMTTALAYMHFRAHAPLWAVASAAILFVAVSVFIVTRPSRRQPAG
jgi:uncharacterized membrane protein YbaN (DUF454 family)